MDFLKAIGAIAETSAPSLLIGFGIGIIVLALVGRVTAHIALPKRNTKLAFAFGFFLLFSGLGVVVFAPGAEFFASDQQPAPGPEPVVPAPVFAGSWYIFVGTYSLRAGAVRLRNDLSEQGYDFEIFDTDQHPEMCNGYFSVGTSRPSSGEAERLLAALEQANIDAFYRRQGVAIDQAMCRSDT